MKENKYLFYSDYLKNRNIKNKNILIAKTKNSYLIGPIINTKFNEKAFYKRIISNSVFSIKIYKKILSKKCIKLIEKYKPYIGDNEILELYKDNNIYIHKILKVSGD